MELIGTKEDGMLLGASALPQTYGALDWGGASAQRTVQVTHLGFICSLKLYILPHPHYVNLDFLPPNSHPLPT